MKRNIIAGLGVVVVTAICGFSCTNSGEVNNEFSNSKEELANATKPTLISNNGHDPVTMAEFNTAINSSKLTIVDFYTTWCGPCKRMAPDIAKIKETYKGKINVLKVDAEASSDISGKYNIMAYPTIMCFKKGQVLHTSEGMLSYADLESLVKRFE